ncbi:MAG: carbohydrate-binding domain-containing protein, partial [Actinomycetota bacterium]
FDGNDVIGGQNTLYWNAALRLTLDPDNTPDPPDPVDPPTGTTGTIVVTARGTDALDVWPEMSVRVNGLVATPGIVSVETASFAEFTFTTDNMADEPLVDVVFANDGAGGGRDRNLFVDSIDVDGRVIPANDDRVVFDRGSGPAAFDGADTEPGRFSLYVNGALRVDARAVEPVSAQPAREPLDAELVYRQDFSDGAITTDEWIVYDSIGNAGYGLRRPSAISVVADSEATEGGHLLAITADMGTGDEADQLVSGGMMLKVEQTYGRYTMRVRTEPDPDLVTTGVGLLWPVSENWPADGEIDFYETWRDRLSRVPVDLSLHDQVDGQHVVDGLTLVDGSGDPVDGSQWHTYQLDWRPDYLAVSVDGGPPQVLPQIEASLPDVPMRLAIQLDAWQPDYAPGEQPTISAPVRMYVDWVSVERYGDFATDAGQATDEPAVDEQSSLETPPNRERPEG